MTCGCCRCVLLFSPDIYFVVPYGTYLKNDELNYFDTNKVLEYPNYVVKLAFRIENNFR